MSNQNTRYIEARKVTLIGAVINALLGSVKIIGGYITRSHALMADGAHSISDLLTDVMVVLASKFGNQEADDSHPYGHKRFETAGTLLLALFLMLVGIGIAWDAILELLDKQHDRPEIWALPIIFISILAKEILYHYTKHIGNKISSELIIANAWHHRSDALSSVVVAIGLIGTQFGLYYLDSLAAVIVGAMIVKMGFDYGWNSVRELVDTAADAQTMIQIEKTIKQVDGVAEIHQLRSRHMGEDIYIDVHILVTPSISVSEGHFIAQNVHHALMTQIKTIKDVTVHVDPEDDEICCPSFNLPSRKKLNEEFLDAWQKYFPGITSFTLHYLDGQLHLDILCKEAFNDQKMLLNQVKKDLTDRQIFSSVRMLQEHQIT